MDKHVSDSIVEQVYQLRPEHLNGAGRLFGGTLMSWIDEVAGLVAIRHAQTNVLTASVDHLEFLRGAKQNDLIVLVGKLTYVGNTSMEVRVDTYVESYDGTREQMNRAYLTLVSIDAQNKPKPAPRLILDNDEERAEWEAGKRRKELRKQMRKEGF